MIINSICLAGAGRAAKELSIPALNDITNSNNRRRSVIKAVADIDESMASKICEMNMANNSYTNVQLMLEQEKPDILIINSPVSSHFEYAMLAIDMGINFILEKPATATVKELIEISDSTQKKGVKGMVVHNYKFLPGFQKVWDWYSNGMLGDILHIERVWMTPPHEDRMERDSKGWWHNLTGGRLADSLPHHLYVSYPFVGEMELKHVDVKKMAKDRPWSVCDEANITLSTEKGYVNIRLSTNQKSWPDKKGSGPYDALLYGTKQCAAMFHNDANYFRHPTTRSNIKLGWDTITSVVKRKLSKALGQNIEQGIKGGHNVMFSRFFDYLEGKTENPVPWSEAIHVMKLSDEIGVAMQEKMNNQIIT